MISAQRVRVFAIERGGLLALASLIAYSVLAPTYIVGDGDSAELATIGHVGGVPHPSGYPTYVLWLRLMSWLPGSAAHAAGLATAILGALTVLVLHAACRAWGARPLAATVAVAVFAASPVMVRLSSEAEVFVPNVLLVSTIVWLAALDGPARGNVRAGLLGLVAGLALANHLTCIAIAPLGILGVVRGIREAPRRAVAPAIALGAFVLGLTPYLYFLVAPDTPVSWRHMNGLGDLARHFMRVDYGLGTLSPNREAVPASESLGALVSTVGRAWWWVLPVAALGVFARRPEARRDTTVGWIALVVSIAIAGPVLISRFNIPPHDIGRILCSRFHLLPAMLLAIPIAVGLDALGQRAAEKMSSRARSAQGLATGIALVLFAALTLRSIPARSPAVEHAVKNMLAPVPKDAVVIVSEDDLYFGSMYAQLALGLRTDVTVISWGQLLNPEYRARLHERADIVMLTPGDKLASTTIAADLLARGRPLLVDSTKMQVLQKFPSYPIGTLFRVVPQGSQLPPIAELFETNKQLYDTFELEAAPDADDLYAIHAHERYARIWQIIERALTANGLNDRATVAHSIVSAFQERR